MTITQSAGDCTIETYTDGYPPAIHIKRFDDKMRMSVDDLHDLRYCIDRTLQQLADADRAKDRHR